MGTRLLSHNDDGLYRAISYDDRGFSKIIVLTELFCLIIPIYKTSIQPILCKDSLLLQSRVITLWWEVSNSNDCVLQIPTMSTHVQL
jgi:hypothetical protein